MSADDTPAGSPHRRYVSEIARGAGIVFTGTVLSLALRYLFQVIVARRLGIEAYGLFSLGIAAFSVAEMVAALGMNRGMVRFVALHNRDEDARLLKGTLLLGVRLSLGVGAVTGLLLFAFAGVLATNVFRIPELAWVLRVLAIGVPLSALTTVLVSSSQGLKIMRHKVWVRDIFEMMVRVLMVLALFRAGWEVGGAVAAFVLSLTAGALLSTSIFRRTFRRVLERGIRPEFPFRELMRFCWPLLFANGFIYMEAWISTFMLGAFLGPGPVGVFSAAYRTSLLVQGIIMSFGAIFSPIISDLLNRGEPRQLERLFKLVSRWIFTLSLPASLLIILFSRDLMSLFGLDFIVGTTALIILSLGQILNAATGPLGVMIDMSGRSKLTLLNSALHFIIQAALCVWLIPIHGIMGAAVAKALSIFFLRFVRLWQVHATLRMHPFQMKLLKPFAAACAAGLPLVVLNTLDAVRTAAVWYRIPLGGAAFLAVYGIMLYILGLDREDRELFERLRSRLAL
jgi:O-antigen/teichoic acid export membrane protein